MLKTVTREITLSLQARNGINAAALVWMAVIAAAAFTAFIFLCIAGYAWLSARYDPVSAALIMAAVFIVLAALAAMIVALIRRHVRQRAILARAAKAHTPPWLLDPRILGVAVEAGRSLGWQRIVPMALVGFMAAQWAREHRDRGHQ
jgi:MFS family permease